MMIPHYLDNMYPCGYEIRKHTSGSLTFLADGSFDFEYESISEFKNYSDAKKELIQIMSMEDSPVFNDMPLYFIIGRK